MSCRVEVIGETVAGDYVLQYCNNMKGQGGVRLAYLGSGSVCRW
jgi:hypothetical protein